VAVEALQERYSPGSICFGCGPANERGLHVRSFVEGDEVVATWQPEAHHQAFPGMLNAHHLMTKAGLDAPPCTVTADYAIRLKRPTPVDAPVHLRARVVESSEDRAVIEATMTTGDAVTATCRGTFVAVKPGHPAYHRW
jgi:acyl-coenzyme A thioesterase PaaI-like protein